METKRGNLKARPDGNGENNNWSDVIQEIEDNVMEMFTYIN